MEFLVDCFDVIFVGFLLGSDDELVTHWLLRQVHVHMRRVPMAELPQGGDEIAKWCHDAFEIKVRIKIHGKHKVFIRCLW